MRFILQRYLAANFLLPLVVSTLFFVIFLLTFDMFRLTSVLMSRDIGAGFILGLMMDLALTFIPLAVPLATFFSVMFCVGKLSGDSEYIALRAAGMKKGTIYLPFFIISIVVALTANIMAENLTPYTNRDFKKKIQFLTSSGILSEIKEGQFFTYIPKVTLFAVKVKKKGERLEQVFLRLQEENDSEKIIFAQKGALIYERNTDTLIESLKLELFHGHIITKKSKGEEVEKILFESYYLPISQNKFSTRITPKETMLNRQELAEVIKMPLKKAKKKYRFDERDMFNAQYEYWNRKNVPLLVILFTFLGFSLGVKENRGKGKNSALIGLVTLILYYTMMFSLISLARSEKVPLIFSMIFPNIMLLSIAIYYYRKLDWQG